MTKKLVAQALALAMEGKTADALKTIRFAEQGYARKRLAHLANCEPTIREIAVNLFAEAFPAYDLNLHNVSSPPDELAGRDESAESWPTPTVQRLELPRRVSITQPLDFLRLISNGSTLPIDVDEFDYVEPWALAAIATLARTDGAMRRILHGVGNSPAGRFAHALGVHDVATDRPVSRATESGRTVRLRRVTDFSAIESTAADIARLLIDTKEPKKHSASPGSDYIDAEETQLTIRYVIVELLRNVLQHSNDCCGAVVGAQHMNWDGTHGAEPTIQVVVADEGVGIYKTLSAMHSEIKTPAAALERSLWPYISGKFDATRRGSSQNAGLGLFFISEMAKLAAGRLVIASRGATMRLDASKESLDRMQLDEVGFPGTLAVFEVPRRGVADYDALIRTIGDRALERAAKREGAKLIRYDLPPVGTPEFVVSIAAENTVVAEHLAQTEFIPRLALGNAIAINFANVDVCTQSFLHALLFDAIRVAWARRTPIYAVKTREAVVDGLRLLEAYALDVD